jgi:hypothetical protein
MGSFCYGQLGSSGFDLAQAHERNAPNSHERRGSVCAKLAPYRQRMARVQSGATSMRRRKYQELMARSLLIDFIGGEPGEAMGDQFA